MRQCAWTPLRGEISAQYFKVKDFTILGYTVVGEQQIIACVTVEIYITTNDNVSNSVTEIL